MFSRRDSNFFTSAPSQFLPNMLLQYVIDADYPNVFKLLSNNPELMFASGCASDINGEMIATSPIDYILYVADTSLLSICHKLSMQYDAKKPGFLHKFHEVCAEMSQPHMDLQPVIDAYEDYFKHFDAFQKTKMGYSDLRKAWLKVGLAQRNCLPRHLLCAMCRLSPKLEVLSRDTAVLKCANFPSLTSAERDALLKNHQDYPVVIIDNEHISVASYSPFEAKWNVIRVGRYEYRDSSGWNFIDRLSLNEGEFVIRHAEIIGDYDISISDYFPWDNYHSLKNNMCVQVPMFAKFGGYFKPLFPLASHELGTKFVLARGVSALCYAPDNPTGNNHLLKHKLAHDLKNFIKLYTSAKAEIQQYKLTQDSPVMLRMTFQA